jgi:hypothetical protein
MRAHRRLADAAQRRIEAGAVAASSQNANVFSHDARPFVLIAVMSVLEGAAGGYQ